MTVFLNSNQFEIDVTAGWSFVGGGGSGAKLFISALPICPYRSRSRPQVRSVYVVFGAGVFANLSRVIRQRLFDSTQL